MINVGENFGLIKTRIIKSVRNSVITYFIGKKLSLKRICIKEKNVAKNSIPADALISLSFKTGMLYPSTSSPNFIVLFIFSCFGLCRNIFAWHLVFLTQEYLIKESNQSNSQ